MTKLRLTVAPGAWPALWATFDPLSETVAFVVGHRTEGGWRVDAFWPTPNLWEEKPGGRDIAMGYSIGRPAWKAARARAKADGVDVLGHVHSHVYESAVPSYWDVKAVKPGDLGAVWHLGSGRVYWFTTAAGDNGKRRLEPVACHVAELSSLMRAWQECGYADPLAEAPKGWPRAVRLSTMQDTPELRTMSARVVAAVASPEVMAQATASAGVEAEVVPDSLAPLRDALAALP